MQDYAVDTELNAGPPKLQRKRSLGQHFLHDRRVLDGIVRALDPRDDEMVVEVGPGTGRLTQPLVDRTSVERVVCVERDAAMIVRLGEKFPGMEVHDADAARFDFSTLRPGVPAVLASNLPYNASTAIYFHLLFEHRDRFRRFVLMFQREVADRLLATPERDRKAYGPPAVMTSILCTSRLVMKVWPSAFRPPPKVESAVVCIEPLAEPRFGVAASDVTALNRFVHALFAQRRKTLVNNLRAAHGGEAAT